MYTLRLFSFREQTRVRLMMIIVFEEVEASTMELIEENKFRQWKMRHYRI